MTTQDIDNVTIKATARTESLTTLAKFELATNAGAKVEREAFVASCNKLTKRLAFGSLGSLLGTVPVALFVHAMIPVVVVSSVITGGAIACLSLGLLAVVSLANTPEKSTEDSGQETDQNHGACVRAAAEAVCDEVVTNATVREGEIVFFKDPSLADGRLALFVTEVREYKESAQSSSMQRIVARVFSVPSDGGEFAKRSDCLLYTSRCV